jgi:hypothetical protein
MNRKLSNQNNIIKMKINRFMNRLITVCLISDCIFQEELQAIRCTARRVLARIKVPHISTTTFTTPTLSALTLSCLLVRFEGRGTRLKGRLARRGGTVGTRRKQKRLSGYRSKYTRQLYSRLGNDLHICMGIGFAGDRQPAVKIMFTLDVLLANHKYL